MTPALPSAVEIAKQCLALNQLEEQLGQMDGFDPPITHRFTPGLVSREIFLTKGILCTSWLHKTEHQFIVSQGKAMTWSAEDGWKLVQAPFAGITPAGSRRAVHVLEDIVWTTFHATNAKTVEELEAEIFEKHEIPKQSVIHKIHRMQLEESA